MKECNVRRKLGTELRRMGFHVSQIESHDTSAGIPDTHYFGHSTDGFIELKVAKINGSVAIRNTQKAWFRDRIKAGGYHQYLLVGFDNGYDRVQFAICRVNESNVNTLLSSDCKWLTVVNNATEVWYDEVDHSELSRIITAGGPND